MNGHTEAAATPGRILYLSPAPGESSPGMGAFRAPAGMEPLDIYDLGSADLSGTTGILVSGMCDQVHLSRQREKLDSFVRSGGRVLVNGHVVETFIEGLVPWRRLDYRDPSDLTIHSAARHPVFEDVDMSEVLFRTGVPGPHDQKRLAEIGVAGFYGRGYHVGLPAGAIVVNTIGPLHAPIDYAYPLGLGEVLVHGGLDLGVFAATAGTTLVRLAPNIVSWLEGTS